MLPLVVLVDGIEVCPHISLDFGPGMPCSATAALDIPVVSCLDDEPIDVPTLKVQTLQLLLKFFDYTSTYMCR